MMDPEYTTGEADAFRAGLARGVEIGLEAAARDVECGCPAGQCRCDGNCGRENAASIRAIDATTLGVGE